MIDRGKKADFFYLVMDLVGSSLSDLKQKSPGRHLSLSCGISASKQCLESVQILHVLGYIHRGYAHLLQIDLEMCSKFLDLKPANFAVGREPKQHTVSGDQLFFVAKERISRFTFSTLASRVVSSRITR